MIETKERVLSKLLSCQVATNLIGTDFNNVIVRSVQTQFEQNRGGLRVAFDISNHAVGKMQPNAQELLWELAKMCGVFVDDDDEAV